MIRTSARSLGWSALALAVTAILGAWWWTAIDEDGLPVRIGEPAGAPRGLVIFLTGDNGIGPIPRALLEEGARRGLRVVVLDSLRYFVFEKPPTRVASDLDILVGRYGRDADGDLPVLLSGFSFGANALPFACAASDGLLQSRVALVALISPTRTTAFHSSPLSLLGYVRGSHDVGAAMPGLSGVPSLCVVGDDDPDNPCRDDVLAGRLHVVRVPGGHRPDVRPGRLVAMLLDAFDAALAVPGRAG